MTEMYVWPMFKGYLAGFYTYPVATPMWFHFGDRNGSLVQRSRVTGCQI